MEDSNSDIWALEKAELDLAKERVTESETFEKIAFAKNFIELVEGEDSKDKELNALKAIEVVKQLHWEALLRETKQNIRKLELHRKLLLKTEPHPYSQSITRLKDELDKENEQKEKSMFSKIKEVIENEGRLVTLAQILEKMEVNKMDAEKYRKMASSLSSILRTYEKRKKLRRTDETLSNKWAYGLPEWWIEDKLDDKFLPKIIL